MNATATTKIAFAALAAPLLAAFAVGLAGTASAENPNVGSAQDTVKQYEDEGHKVVVHKDGTAPLDQCTVIASHQDRHEHHGGGQRNEFVTVYVDAFCPAAA